MNFLNDLICIIYFFENEYDMGVNIKIKIKFILFDIYIFWICK